MAPGGRTYGWTDGRANGRTNGRKDGRIWTKIYIHPPSAGDKTTTTIQW